MAGLLSEIELLAIYTFANTPAYLYKHLRARPSVQSLALSVPAYDLFKFVRETDHAAEAQASEVAAAYACAAALSLKPDDELAELAADYQPHRLRWLGYFISASQQANMTATNTRTVSRIGPSQPIANSKPKVSTL